MRLVRDHKRFTHRLPDCNPIRLRGMIHVHETTETYTTEHASAPEPKFPVTKVAAFVPVTPEMLAETQPYRDLVARAYEQLAHYWTTSESVELGPEVTRDDAAVALWQAANVIETYERSLRELEEKVDRMQATAKAMLGDVDECRIAELLGIPTED